MAFWAITILVIAGFLELGVHGSCPSDMVHNDQFNICYQKVTDVKTWDDAQTYCTELAPGGHMVEVMSKDKQDFVEKIMAGGETWYGGRRVPNGGVNDFEWSYSHAGIDSNTNWQSGQPDKDSWDPKANPDCILGYDWKAYKWHDRGCGHEAPFLCERSACPAGMDYNEDFDACYQKVADAKTWDDAQALCEALGDGGHIVEVKSQAKQTFVETVMAGGETWYGGRRVANGGVTDFKWSFSQVAIVYTNWEGGQPDKDSWDPKANPDCLLGYDWKAYKWHDRGCGHEAPFLCEINFA